MSLGFDDMCWNKTASSSIAVAWDVLNPSPFLVNLNFDDIGLVASSPEILVRVRDGKVTIRPIAGTRKRGKNTPQGYKTC